MIDTGEKRYAGLVGGKSKHWSIQEVAPDFVRGVVYECLYCGRQGVILLR